MKPRCFQWEEIACNSGGRYRVADAHTQKQFVAVVAQLVDRSITIPEIRSSNPVNGKFYIEHLFADNCIEKTKIKKKRP